MNRKYLLDSLDGLKALVLRLLPGEIAGSLACVPMTTDAPWTPAEKKAYETAIGISGKRTYWKPGGFLNVPRSPKRDARSRWVNAVAAINHEYLFLDPDTGFYTHPTAESEKVVLIDELAVILCIRKALVVYRHQYWPRRTPDGRPDKVYPYVWHGLHMLKEKSLVAFAYQAQAASLFFVSKQKAGIQPFQAALRCALSGISPAVTNRRLICSGVS